MQTANITLKDLSFTQSLWNLFLFKLIFCEIAAVAKKQEKWVWTSSFSWFYEKFRNRANLILSITKEKAFPNFQYMFFLGSAAQEVIKLITHQFVPFNNTYIYNGSTGCSITLQV